MFHSWLYLTFGIAKQAVVDRACLAGQFGEELETCEADDVLKDAAVTIISAELMQAFASIRTDKIALRKAVQLRLRRLKVDHHCDTGSLPAALYSRCTSALQLK